MKETEKNFKDLEKNKENLIISSNLKKGICCQLQSEGYLSVDQLVWLLNEIKEE